MFSLRCHETSLSAACTMHIWPSISAPSPLFWRDQVLLTRPPTPPPPPFCWLAPRAPICAQAELILGPWNNNYRSYSQSIDTEWAIFRGRPEIPQLLILSYKQSQNTNWNSWRILQQREYSCTVSILSCPNYIQDTPVAACPLLLPSWVSLRKYPCIVPPLYIAQQ